MNPGDIMRDEAREHWRVMDARRAVGEEFEALLSPVLMKKIEIRKNGDYCGSVTEWPDDPGRNRTFKRTSETLRWRKVS